MNWSKFGRLTLLLVVVITGLWLMMRRSGPIPETAVHQQAVQAFAPIGADRPNTEITTASGASSPTVVNLKDIPAGVYDPDNQFDRWKRGEIDLDEQDGIRSMPELAAMRAASANLAPSANINQAISAPELNAPTSGAKFDSIDYTECCGGGGNVPPDPELAVGPNHVIAVVNVAFEIYNKNGVSLVGPTTFASFLAADPNCTGVFDPNALYDEAADRYVLGIDADGTHYCLAVSQTGDPTGSWNIYSFATTNSRREFFDYPHAGVGQDAIYMGANIFNGNRYGEGRVWAFDKWAMYNGQAAASAVRGLGASEDTPQPLNLHGFNQGTWPTSGPHYIFTETNYDGSTHTVFSWSDPFGANTFSTVGTINLNAATGVTAGMPVDTPQLGGQTIQANDFRPQDFEYRNGYAWSSSTIACNPGSGTVNCVRWAQIDPATATVAMAGVYGSNGDYRTFADLAVNACDDMAVGYTKSSTSIYPSIWYTGRQSTDSAGTLQAEAQLKAGEITYTSFETSAPRRWGDYTEMTIAPDGVTFWYLGEYSKNTGTTNGRWGTYIGSFSYSCNPGNPQPTPTPQPAGSMHVGDLDGSTASANGGRWNATITIVIHDGNEAPLANATVNGSWSGGASGSDSCITNGSGQCSITKNNISRNSSSATFTVTNVTHTSNAYQAGNNHDPDGDSNGTAITVFKP